MEELTLVSYDSWLYSMSLKKCTLGVNSSFFLHI